MKMKPGFKFASFTSTVVFLCCSLVSCTECSAIEFYYTTGNIFGVIGILSTIFAGNYHVSALPPSLFRKRLGSPMPQIGSPISNDDEDSDEDEEDAMDDVDDENQSRPRQEPHITPMNRDQCLAKLLCGMSVPVTGGSSKKNYYNEYADIVSKFFEAFPYDGEFQSKESIETYDDYSNEDDGKPTRMNSKRKPLNSTRMAATAPTLQLFDLALVDVGKPEDLAKNRTRKAAFEKVPTGNRIARARRIVENLGQKLQTVRECQSIQGCPFTFKQLREKLRKKEAQKISSNVPLPPGPVWPISQKRKNEPSTLSFQPKPYTRPQNRPRPLPPVQKPESTELFSNEEPTFPFKDTKTGDDEMEEIFGPAQISKKPLGFHQGVDENFNYEYDKPWRPGQNEDNSYNHNPWKSHGRPRPQPKPFSRPGNEAPHRMPPRPRPGGNQPGNQKRYPSQNQNSHSQYPRRPQPPPPVVVKSRPKKPVSKPQVVAPVTTTPRSPFPKKKISYLSSPYAKPNINSGEDDEGSEDINKVAPVELIGNLDAGEQEPTTTSSTAKPAVTETTTASSNKKKKDDDDDSDEYDDDDYYDDDYDDDDQNDDDDEYSDEEEDDKESDAKKKKQKEKAKDKKKKNKQKKKEEKDEDEDEEEDEEDEKTTTTTTTSSTTEKPVTKKKKVNSNKYFDDETEDLDEIWTKLNFATTGANHKAPEKYKKKDSTSAGESEGVQEATTTVSEEDAEADDAEEEDEDDDEDARKGSLMTLQKVRASSSSASDEDDDELDEENLSKPKRYKLKSTGKKTKTPKDEDEADEEELAADLGEPQLITREEIQTKPRKTKSKKKKTKKKPAKKGSSEEEDISAATLRKQVMMEIGGRPLVPKPDHDSANQKKTTSLIGNRFKFQFINPYGPAPPGDSNLPGAYTPLKTSFGPNPVGSSAGSSMGGSHPSAMSSLPFKFKLNPGALGHLAGGGGGHMVPIGGFPGSSSSASGSIEMPDPHHPPQTSVYTPPQQQNSQPHQQRHEHFSSQSSGLSGGSMGGLGGSSLFKLNPLPALSSFFKRPSSSSFDPINGPADGHGPPPATAFVHRPIGPESSHYNRERPSPASGSSNPASKSSAGSSSSSSNGSTKKYKAKSKSRSNKGKSGKL